MAKNKKLTYVIAECCRVLLGAVFIFSGMAKAVDPVGFGIKISEYLTAFGLDGFTGLSTFISFNLIAIEFMLGVCVLLAAYRKYASFFVLVMMAFMTPLTLYLALFNPVSDCGCFGDAVVITNWETFFKNVVLIAAAIFLYLNNPQMKTIYSFKVIWFIPLFSYLFCIGFAYYNYIHLPIYDFRPYKVGVNIPDKMSVPEGAPTDVYNYSFVYEKDGVEKEFPLNELPDSTWVFAYSKTELVKKGYQPEIEGFHLYDFSGTEVTDEILYSDKAVLLLIAPKIEDANDDRIEVINNMYDYTLENDFLFCAATGSSVEKINEWCDYTGAEYSFLQADDVMLKTIIRSNPGMVLLKGGTILGKWNYRDLPEEESIEPFLSGALSGAGLKAKEGRLMIILLSFAVPLLLVWIYDLFRNREIRRATVSGKR